MIFYVLLSYGNRPAGSIRAHPAAKAQLAFVNRLVSRNPEIKVDLQFDYTRRVKGLRSLPTLERVLTKVKPIDGIKVRIDNLSRLFRIAEMSDREQLLADLRAFDSKLISLKHGKTLSEFSANEIHNLILHAEKSTLPAQRHRGGDTGSARASSLVSRKDSSVRLAKQLESIKDELIDIRHRATLRMVADEANARGMRTTRGGKWTPQNVDRMLKSVEREEQKE